MIVMNGGEYVQIWIRIDCTHISDTDLNAQQVPDTQVHNQINPPGFTGMGKPIIKNQPIKSTVNFSPILVYCATNNKAH